MALGASTVDPVALTELRHVLGSSPFRRLFAVRLTGQFADGLVQAALATFVLFSPERQATAPRIAIAFVVLLLPYSLIGPFVGVFLDRWRRRGVLVYANLLRTLSVSILATLVVLGHDGGDLALAVLVTLGIGRFVLAGLSASLPHTVEPSGLVTANALSPTAGTVASSIGGLLGVGIRALSGGGDRGSMVVLACAGIGYLCASFVARTIPRDLLGPHGDIVGEGVRDVWRGLIDGFHHLRERRAASDAIAVVSMHRIAFGAATVLAILILRNTLNDPNEPAGALAGLTVVVGVTAAGALIGAVLTPWATRHLGSVPWSVMSLLIAAVLTIVGLLGTTLNWPGLTGITGLLVAGFGIGYSGQSVKVTSDTIVQKDVSDDHRGRVFSLYDVSVNIGLVIGVVWIAFTSPISGMSALIDVLISLVLVLAAGWYFVVSRRRGSLA